MLLPAVSDERIIAQMPVEQLVRIVRIVTGFVFDESAVRANIERIKNELKGN